MKSVRLITVLLLAVMGIALLAACGGDDATPTPDPVPVKPPTTAPTPTSTPTPQPTPPQTTPTPTPTVTSTPPPPPVETPMPTPTPTPTPEPAALDAEGFLAQCGQESLALAAPFAAMGDLTQMGPGDDLSWGQLGDLYSEIIGVYERMNPPEDLRAYHDAWVGTAEALRDFANSRPSGSSFLGDILTLMFEGLMVGSMEIALDPSKTDEEKQQLIEAMAEETFGEFFGPDFIEAGMAFEEAREALSEDTVALLEGSECYFGISPIEAMEGEVGLGSDPSFEDDHADEWDNATVIEVGESVEGMVDYEGDLDIFRFRAQQEVVYMIAAELRIEEANWSLGLYGRRGQFQDFADSVPIFWQAPASDDYYLEFSAATQELGPYTLSVSLATDDHGNSPSTSTRLDIGESMEGTIDYNTDLDYFVFPARAGQSYMIAVEGGTLPEVQLTLYSSENVAQDFGITPLTWQAPNAGDYYIEAGSFGFTGTYAIRASESN